MGSRSESAVRSRAIGGDRAAFALLYQRHHQALYRYCRSILRHEEDAKDALQSTMAKAFSALQTEQRDFEVRPWLFRIAHNEAISVLRQRRPTENADALEVIGSDTLSQTVEDRERLAHLRDDLRDLGERQRSALVLRELNGLSHEEIAGVLETSPRAVKQTIFEARSALLECAEGRAMACEAVQRTLSDGDGRVVRSRRVRAHVRSCRSCRRFRDALQQRPADLAVLAPPLPVVAGAALLAHLLPGAKASLAGAGASTGAVSAGMGASVATKAAVIAATAVAVAGGTVAVKHVVGHQQGLRTPATITHRPAAGPGDVRAVSPVTAGADRTRSGSAPRANRAVGRARQSAGARQTGASVTGPGVAAVGAHAHGPPAGHALVSGSRPADAGSAAPGRANDHTSNPGRPTVSPGSTQGRASGTPGASGPAAAPSDPAQHAGAGSQNPPAITVPSIPALPAHGHAGDPPAVGPAGGHGHARK